MLYFLHCPTLNNVFLLSYSYSYLTVWCNVVHRVRKFNTIFKACSKYYDSMFFYLKYPKQNQDIYKKCIFVQPVRGIRCNLIMNIKMF